MLDIVVPMGGEGRQFAERGSTFPKPLVEIHGRPMIEVVQQNLAPSAAHRFIFICRAEHLHRYALGDVLRLIAPGCAIVPMHEPTAGALCSVLLAANHLDPEGELVVANADQVIDVSMDEFLAFARRPGTDGCIVTFPSTHPKWSYARVDENGDVVMVAEKRPISRQATSGIYYFRSAAEFLEGAERMILKNASLAGEFYVCPVYNEFILDGRRVSTFPLQREQMHSLGTPEDLDRFIAGTAGHVSG